MTRKGYMYDDFADVFARYTPTTPPPSPPSATSTTSATPLISDVADVADNERQEGVVVVDDDGWSDL